MPDNSVSRQLCILGRQFTIRGTGDYVEAMRNGRYYDEIFEIFKKVVKPDAICLDIGANVGLSALTLASLATKGRVFALEADSRTCQFLTRNIRENGLSNVTAEQCFVGLDGSRKTFLFCAHDPSRSPSMKPELVARINRVTELWDPVEVQCRSVDEFVLSHGLERLDFIKLDCEGADIEILSSARHTLERFRPTVVLEFNSFCLTTFARTNPADAIDTVLATFPYVWRILPSRRTLRGRAKSTLQRIFPRRTGGPTCSSIERVSDSYIFIHDHIVFHNGFDDLLCAFSDIEPTIVS
jgi:FkbM family methyltransferase